MKINFCSLNMKNLLKLVNLKANPKVSRKFEHGEQWSLEQRALIGITLSLVVQSVLVSFR